MAMAISTRPATSVTGCLGMTWPPALPSNRTRSAGGQGEAEDEAGNGDSHKEFAHVKSPHQDGEIVRPIRTRELIWISGRSNYYDDMRLGQ